MITVIATGFDGGKKRQTVRHEAAATDGMTARPARERDFLEELQRQRDEVAENHGQRDDQAAAVTVGARLERSVGEVASTRKPAPSYDAEDLEIPSFLRRK